MAATPKTLAAVPGVGAVVAESVVEFLADAHNQEMIDKLRAHGVRFVADASAARVGRSLARRSCSPADCRWRSPEAGAGLSRRWRSCGQSVTKATDYVVVGEDPGSKFTKAQALGVTVVDEGGLLELLAAADGGEQLASSPGKHEIVNLAKSPHSLQAKSTACPYSVNTRLTMLIVSRR